MAAASPLSDLPLLLDGRHVDGLFLGPEPPRSIINEALAQQIVITQPAIASSLDLPVSTEVPSVSRVRIEQQEQIKLDGVRLVHLRLLRLAASGRQHAGRQR